MNDEHFKRQFDRLAAVFETRFLPDTYRLSMFNALAKLSDEEMTAAVDHLIENFVPSTACRFPVPANIYQAAREWARSTQAVPLPVQDEQAQMQRDEDTWSEIQCLPRDEYERIEALAKERIDDQGHAWLLQNARWVLPLAIRGFMIEIYRGNPGEVLAKTCREPHAT